MGLLASPFQELSIPPSLPPQLPVVAPVASGCRSRSLCRHLLAHVTCCLVVGTQLCAAGVNLSLGDQERPWACWHDLS